MGWLEKKLGLAAFMADFGIFFSTRHGYQHYGKFWYFWDFFTFPRSHFLFFFSEAHIIHSYKCIGYTIDLHDHWSISEVFMEWMSMMLVVGLYLCMTVTWTPDFRCVLENWPIFSVWFLRCIRKKKNVFSFYRGSLF